MMERTELFNQLKNAVNLYFIGIGGVSMSSAAMFAKERGYHVAGSDKTASAATEKLKNEGVSVFIPHKADNVAGADAVIYTAAVNMENPEMRYARDHDIPLVTRAEFLGFIMSFYPSRIGVSGTHGKSTTTSMISHIFLCASLDPTIALGAELACIGGTYHIGTGDEFIYESCEYKDSFLSFDPSIAIILNIDHDHVDYFFTMEQMEKSFKKSIKNAHTVIANGSDERVERTVADFGGKVIRFGMDASYDFHPEGLVYDHGCACFTITAFGKPLCAVSLAVPGEHNVLNALAAAAAAYERGIEADSIARGLAGFTGAGRRFEKKGRIHDIDVYDDYAHHPTEIKATLNGVKKLGYRKIFCIFQPHTYTRTAELFSEFAHAFFGADQTIFADIYSAREVNTSGITSADLAEAVPGAVYFDSFEKIVHYVQQNAGAGDLVLTMGAGDVYKIGEMLLQEEASGRLEQG
ncbi:MAG: UDP-N-acetylmuramate--L-alanine ligase [Clostridiales bacterium]|nr:UDP-N-acetylmuramate--L-alanine ligase [Clostridiales bacterium]